MSGGVDSSMALVLLKKAGWKPIGVSLKLPVWAYRNNLWRENLCCTQESLDTAKRVCEKLGVPYYVFDVQKEFQKTVIDYFVKELKQGRTPNPCVICNRYFKFKSLLGFADKQGIKFVATGHYAKTQLNSETEKHELLVSKDKAKDQTYYLSFLTQDMLARIIFPLADYTKQEICQMAEELGFKELTQKRESQDFCFVAGKSMSKFLEKEIGIKPGKIVDENGNALAKHQGIHFYTIGQRKGIGLSGGPYFVKSLDKENNLVVVTKDKKMISQREIILSPFNFVFGQAPGKEMKVMAKIRYGAKLAPAAVYPLNKKLKITFSKPQIAVTPGQVCVFYQSNVCLGGGIIN